MPADVLGVFGIEAGRRRQPVRRAVVLHTVRIVPDTINHRGAAIISVPYPHESPCSVQVVPWLSSKRCLSLCVSLHLLKSSMASFSAVTNSTKSSGRMVVGTPPVMDTACRVHARVRKEEGVVSDWPAPGLVKQAAASLSLSHLDGLQARDEEEVDVGRPVELLP